MKFVENFKNVKDISDSYSGGADDLKGAVVHLAWYGYGDYCGSSLVIYEKGGKLYEVNGSHCSCYGLEGQWSPEETSWEALAKRDISGYCDGSDDANKILARLVKRHIKRISDNALR